MSDRALTKAEVDANVAKTVAETKQLEAKIKTDKAEAEAKARQSAMSLRQSEIALRKTIAEAESEEARGVILKIDALTKQRTNAAALARDEHHRIYIFDQGVDEESVTACIHKLAEWSRIDPKCDIEIIFNSPGGYINEGMALYDYITRIRNAGHKVTTNSLGMAASMAGILLQAGDVRKMGSESWLLIHEASFGAHGSFGRVEDKVEFIKKIQERIIAIFAAKSTLSATQIRNRWNRKDWWLDADEALKLGLIDEIA